MKLRVEERKATKEEDLTDDSWWKVQHELVKRKSEEYEEVAHAIRGALPLTARGVMGESEKTERR